MTAPNKEKPEFKGSLEQSQENKEEDFDHIVNEINELQQKMEAESDLQLQGEENLSSEGSQPEVNEPLTEVFDESQSEEELLRELTKTREDVWEAEKPVHDSSSISQKEVHLENLLSMKIQGKMAVQLNYDADQFVLVDFNGPFLQIRLSGGVELKIPQFTKHSKKNI